MVPQHIVVLFNLAYCQIMLEKDKEAKDTLEEGVRVFESETDHDLKEYH